MQTPLDPLRQQRALAILAGLVANPETVRLDLDVLVRQAVRLADMLADRLAEGSTNA